MTWGKDTKLRRGFEKEVRKEKERKRETMMVIGMNYRENGKMEWLKYLILYLSFMELDRRDMRILSPRIQNSQLMTSLGFNWNVLLYRIRDGINLVMDKQYPDEKSRPMLLPVEWRSQLILDDGQTDWITLPKMSSVRNTLNSTAMDIMYYQSPLYRQEVREKERGRREGKRDHYR